jgi:hypothetical protein
MPRNRARAARLTALAALLFVVLSGCVATSPGTAPGSAAATGSRSFIVQISSLGPAYSPATLASWVQQACASTQSGATAPPRDLILQDIANSDGSLATAYLDAIVPFLPGGAEACFRRVFVGTIDLSWSGPGSKYVEGIQDTSFRDRQLTISNTLASAFVLRYPTVPIDWYLTYEANLNDLYSPAVESAYRSLMTAEMQSLSSLRPGATFAWSPAFWYPYSVYSSNVAGMTQLRANLHDLFSSLQRTTAGIQLLDLQDFVAGSRCQPDGNRVTAGDAVSWAGFLAGLGQIPEVTLNVEQYAVDCATGGIGPGDPAEIRSRESFYASHAITLGPAFELRYWIHTH